MPRVCFSLTITLAGAEIDTNIVADVHLGSGTVVDPDEVEIVSVSTDEAPDVDLADQLDDQARRWIDGLALDEAAEKKRTDALERADVLRDMERDAELEGRIQ